MQPSLEQRLAAQNHPITSPVMYQRWSNLLFLHWRWDADDIQRRLPPGLFVDTHEGQAWLGIVPFAMERIRPRFLPAVPWISWFLELNVRTYVFDQYGTPGVWFFSLDCNQPVAVQTARTFFGLPYHHARMASVLNKDGCTQYECQRKGQSEASHFEYSLSADSRLAIPGSLDFFLAERYVLFASTERGLKLGRVHHMPYPLSIATVPTFDQRPLFWNGFNPLNSDPDHIIGSHGVDVRVGALQPLQSLKS